MVLQLLTILLSVLVHVQTNSCIDPFAPEAFVAAKSGAETELYGWDVTWTSDHCIWFATGDGLTVVDLNVPDHRLTLASTMGMSIDEYAINPLDGSIAFNGQDENSLFIANPDGSISTMQAEGAAITDIAFSPDDALLAVASSDKESEYGLYYAPRVEIFNLVDQTAIAHFDSFAQPGYIAEMTFSADSHYLLTHEAADGYPGSAFEYWDIAATSKIWGYSNFILPKYWTRELNMLPFTSTIHNEYLAVWGLYGYMNDYNYYGDAVLIADIDRRKPIVQIIVNVSSHQDANGYDARITDLAFTSDDSLLASSSSDGTITFWKSTDGSQQAEFETVFEQVWQISFSPDDRLLAFVGNGGILIWDVAQMETSIILQ